MAGEISFLSAVFIGIRRSASDPRLFIKIQLASSVLHLHPLSSLLLVRWHGTAISKTQLPFFSEKDEGRKQSIMGRMGQDTWGERLFWKDLVERCCYFFVGFQGEDCFCLKAN